jgi:uncharacterized ion transporter superfamily protein YfcC
VVDRTGAFNEVISVLGNRFQHAPERVLILFGILFTAAGALINIYEEIVAMVPFLVLMADRIGYSRIAAVAISLGSATVGAAFSPSNPFGVLLAQKMADVEPFSGSLFRVIVLLIAASFWIYWVVRNGKSSTRPQALNTVTVESVSPRSVIILSLIVITISTMAYGILNWNWDYNQMSAVFLAMGIACGLIGNLGINGTSRAYAAGFQEMAFAAIIVGLARSVYLILDDGKVIDTIVHGLFDPLRHLPVLVSAVGLTFSQGILHIPVPSNSGQAVLTTPLVTPLADLIGLSRQTMILCYQYGAISMDLLTPTNGGLLAILTAAGISFGKWFRYCWKPFLVVFGIGLAAIMVAVLTGF